jgi:hypothetical protein
MSFETKRKRTSSGSVLKTSNIIIVAVERAERGEDHAFDWAGLREDKRHRRVELLKECDVVIGLRNPLCVNRRGYAGPMSDQRAGERSAMEKNSISKTHRFMEIWRDRREKAPAIVCHEPFTPERVTIRHVRLLSTYIVDGLGALNVSVERGKARVLQGGRKL